MRIPFQRLVFLLLLSVFVAAPFSAQQGSSSAAPAPPPSIDDKFVHDHFGKEFTLMPEFPAMVADMNGDGIDDLVLAARTKSPMLDAGGFEYTVSDPYHSFYGFGDPKVTSAFTTDDPTRKSIVLLVIHGSGPEAWRAEKPKGKFVLINIPVQTVSVRRVKMGKKLLMAIGVEEYGGDRTTSAIFWDGNVKKNTGSYKYEPIGAAMDQS
jgi:hypothetical protein